MRDIAFSILIPSIPSRQKMLSRLIENINDQIGDMPVEVLSFIDNKRRTIGEKRDALVRIANGRFLAFLDDDDLAHKTYVKDIVSAIHENPDVDVIVFNQEADIDGKKFKVEFGLEYENEQAQLGEDGQYSDIKRAPFHVCAWSSRIAKKYRFEPLQDAEDWLWCKQLIAEAKTQHRINKTLHTYRYNSQVTEAK
jgi:glycosyltransferase involved in cell wall biosynthesis